MSIEVAKKALLNGKGTLTWRSVAVALLLWIANDLREIKAGLTAMDKRLLAIELTYVKR
jgi:hypothetical protein